MYGPGRPPRAVNASAVSSVTQGSPSCQRMGETEDQPRSALTDQPAQRVRAGPTLIAAAAHLALATSCVLPWISGTVEAKTVGVSTEHKQEAGDRRVQAAAADPDLRSSTAFDRTSIPEVPEERMACTARLRGWSARQLSSEVQEDRAHPRGACWRCR